MNLLIDLGNTALKWATSDDPESPHTLVHGGSHHFPDKFLSDWRGRGFRHVYGCSVASRDLTLSLTRQIESLGMQVTWLKAQDRYSGDFQLINQYKTLFSWGQIVGMPLSERCISCRSSLCWLSMSEQLRQLTVFTRKTTR